MSNVKILESIHHGQYRHKRVVELYALTELTVRGLLASSAYPSLEPSAKVVADLLANLKEQGAAQHGWADFEVLTDEHDGPTPKTFEAPVPRTWEVFYLLHRGPGIDPYRTNAIVYAATAEDALRKAENETRSDSSYRWQSCQVVGVIPSEAMDAMTAEARKAFKTAMWSDGE